MLVARQVKNMTEKMDICLTKMVTMVIYMLTQDSFTTENKNNALTLLYKNFDKLKTGKKKLQPFKIEGLFLTSKERINMGVNGSVDVLRISAAIKLMPFYTS